MNPHARVTFFALFALCSAAASASDSDADGQWHAVRGSALRAQIADQDLGDGVHYAYQFHRDGRLSGMNMGKPEQGVWKVVSSGLCMVWTRRKSEAECYEVRRRGVEVKMFRDGFEALSGTLTPIAPQPTKEKNP